MPDLIAARMLTAISLAFHIIFSAIGVTMPLMMVIAEGMWLRTKNRAYYDLARKWAKANAVLFAIGAVSGTALSFEMGLLWPGFMKFGGGIIGLPFGLEGFAFFTEAIFIGIYLYGWERLSPKAHWLSGIPIAIAGPVSAFFIMAVNGWMNAPSGFDYNPTTGQVSHINPIGALFNPAAPTEILHMTLAGFLATSVAMSAIYAWGLLKGRSDDYHKKALAIVLTVVVVVAPLQFISGDRSANYDANNQPVKFAAMEGQYQTQANAPLRLLGIEIPGLLSWLGYGDTNAVVKGLNDVPADQQPPAELVHPAFEIMVVSGSLILLVAIIAVIAALRRKLYDSRRLLWALLLIGPLGYLAIESGWMVTELGRQPWIVYGIVRTSAAVTTAPGLVAYLVIFTALYVLLGSVLVGLLRRMAIRGGGYPEQKEGVSVAIA